MYLYSQITPIERVYLAIVQRREERTKGFEILAMKMETKFHIERKYFETYVIIKVMPTAGRRYK